MLAWFPSQPHIHTHTQRILISTPHIRTKVCVSLLLCLYSVSSERSMSICASFCHTANLAPGSGYKTTEQKQKHETASYSGLNCNFKQKTHWAVAQIDLWLLSLGSDTREEKRNGQAGQLPHCGLWLRKGGTTDTQSFIPRGAWEYYTYCNQQPHPEKQSSNSIICLLTHSILTESSRKRKRGHWILGGESRESLHLFSQESATKTPLPLSTAWPSASYLIFLCLTYLPV